MKKVGIVFLVLATLNLIVAFVALSSNAPSNVVIVKFNALLLLSILGGGGFYHFENKIQYYSL